MKSKSGPKQPAVAVKDLKARKNPKGGAVAKKPVAGASGVKWTDCNEHDAGLRIEGHIGQSTR